MRRYSRERYRTHPVGDELGLATSRPRRFGVRWQAEAGGPGATPLFLAAPKAVSRGIPLLPRHSTAGETAGATALQILSPRTREGHAPSKVAQTFLSAMLTKAQVVG
jgi:hypothetical protein